MQMVPAGRDTAALEISLLLHQSYGPGVDAIAAAERLFDGTDPSGTTIIVNTNEDRKMAATLSLIVALRRHALNDCSEAAYALLLMDYLLIQIGGIAFGSTGNKIVVPRDAVRLFGFLSTWLGRTGLLGPGD